MRIALTTIGKSLLLCGVALGGGVARFSDAGAQAPPAPLPTLRLDAKLYQVPMLAVGRKTKVPMYGLTADRVQLRVDDGPAFAPTYLTTKADAPLSIVVLFDVSGSEAGLLGSFKADLASWAGTSLRPDDEVEFYTVGQKVRRATPFLAASSSEVEKALDGVTDKTGDDIDPIKAGGTRLWDAMYYAAQDLAGRKGVRVVLALTDGKDNGGRHSTEELMKLSAEHGVALFGLRYDSVMSNVNKAMSLGLVFLDRRFEPVCEQTGGLVLATGAAKRMDTLKEFVTLLRTRYVVEFPPPPGMAAGEHWLGIELVDKRLRAVPEQIVMPKDVGTLQ